MTFAFPILESNGVHQNPFSFFREIQDEMNQIFRQSAISTQSEFLGLNVWLKDDTALVTAEIPGVNTEDLEITVTGKSLTVRGKRESSEQEKEWKLLRRERLTGQFSRTIELPFAVDSEAVEAQYKKGILTITLPRAEEDKPRKIAIKN